MREILIVAGEASGDMHAAAVAKELQTALPGIALRGVGGDYMAEAGVQLIEHVDTLGVMGFAEVIGSVPHHLRLLNSLVRLLESGEVVALVVVDYPGFNMRLAARAHRAGVPVLYYIAPQIWAWGERRARKLAGVVDKAAVVLPFEEEFFRARGIDAVFVGHPLLDRVSELPDREEARRALGLPADDKILALFPGSRRQELQRHLGLFAATASVLERRGVLPVVAAAPGLAAEAERTGLLHVEGSSLLLFRAADAALCKSGTSTLEAAVAGCPLVVAYRTSAWTYALARRLVRVPHIALVNLVGGREVVPEFVQRDATVSKLVAALEPLLETESVVRRRQLDDLARVRASLGTPGAAARVAAMVVSLLQ